jgi:hypothetical protein
MMANQGCSAGIVGLAMSHAGLDVAKKEFSAEIILNNMQRMIAAIVAPVGTRSIAIMRACLVSGPAADLDESVDSPLVRRFGNKIQTEFLANHAGKKTTNRMLLPFGCRHDSGNRRASGISASLAENAKAQRSTKAHTTKAHLSASLADKTKAQRSKKVHPIKAHRLACPGNGLGIK